MNKIFRNSEGFSYIEVILVVVVIFLVASSGYFVYRHEHSRTTDNKSATYMFSGYIFPTLPASYNLIYKETAESNSNLSYPDVGYTTKESVAQIALDTRKICENNKFTLNDYTDWLNPVNSQISGSPPEVSYTFQCETNNNTWEFSITNAKNLAYSTFKPPLSDQLLKSNLSKLNWVEVNSEGPGFSA